MKSTIDYPHNTPSAVKATIDSMVTEWERHVDVNRPPRVKVDDVTTEGEYYRLAIEPAGYAFYMDVDPKGRAYDFTLTTAMYSEMLCGSEVSGYKPSWSFRLIPNISCDIGSLNSTLGVSDMTNLEPYEVGLLKLKYNISVEEINLMGGIIREFSKSPNARFSINFGK